MTATVAGAARLLGPRTFAHHQHVHMIHAQHVGERGTNDQFLQEVLSLPTVNLDLRANDHHLPRPVPHSASAC